MNFLQLVCCALLSKSTSLSQQYLETDYGVTDGSWTHPLVAAKLQGYLRRQLKPALPAVWYRKLQQSATIATANTELQQFLTTAIREAEDTGNSLCKCESPAPTPQ